MKKSIVVPIIVVCTVAVVLLIVNRATHTSDQPDRNSEFAGAVQRRCGITLTNVSLHRDMTLDAQARSAGFGGEGYSGTVTKPGGTDVHVDVWFEMSFNREGQATLVHWRADDPALMPAQ